MTRHFDHGAYAGVALILVGLAFLVLTVVPGAADTNVVPALLFAVPGVWFVGMAVVPTRRWWPIIPGGTLLSLAATVAVSPDEHAGAAFLAGLGLTFVAVYLVPPGSRQRLWALITAVVLLLLALLATGVTATTASAVLAIGLIACGVLLLLRRPPAVT
jgi:hypothetical protein